jgi:cathepsin L
MILLNNSEQQLVDCSITNYGCDGGWQSEALKYIGQAGGIDTAFYYSYTSGDTGTVISL